MHGVCNSEVRANRYRQGRWHLHSDVLCQAGHHYRRDVLHCSVRELSDLVTGRGFHQSEGLKLRFGCLHLRREGMEPEFVRSEVARGRAGAQEQD